MIGGHSDVTWGRCAATATCLSAVRARCNHLGVAANPFAAGWRSAVWRRCLCGSGRPRQRGECCRLVGVSLGVGAASSPVPARTPRSRTGAAGLLLLRLRQHALASRLPAAGRGGQQLLVTRLRHSVPSPSLGHNTTTVTTPHDVAPYVSPSIKSPSGISAGWCACRLASRLYEPFRRRWRRVCLIAACGLPCLEVRLPIAPGQHRREDFASMLVPGASTVPCRSTLVNHAMNSRSGEAFGGGRTRTVVALILNIGGFGNAPAVSDLAGNRKAGRKPVGHVALRRAPRTRRSLFHGAVLEGPPHDVSTDFRHAGCAKHSAHASYNEDRGTRP